MRNLRFLLSFIVISFSFFIQPVCAATVPAAEGKITLSGQFDEGSVVLSDYEVRLKVIVCLKRSFTHCRSSSVHYGPWTAIHSDGSFNLEREKFKGRITEMALDMREVASDNIVARANVSSINFEEYFNLLKNLALFPHNVATGTIKYRLTHRRL